MLQRPERHARRRLIRRTVLTAGTVVSVGLAAWMLLDRDATADVATVAGLFVGLAALLLALADFFRQDPTPPDPAALADDLALRLREQWLEEAEARQLRDPRVLPLTWTTTTRDVAEPLPSGVLRMRLDGRLDGRFDEVTARLAEGWAQVPNRRLVAIGEPGSGKTVVAMLLTLGLLKAREQGGPLPVLLPVSSWDPVRERLDDWIVRTLAQPYYNGRAEIPRTLLTHGLLLPVLDGLDEIPESARRSAIRGINQAIGGERPVVVTCRAVEYEELIRGGAPTLRRAAVVEIQPVAAADVIGYLAEADRPGTADWGPVLERLRADPDGPLARALSTPLMVTSARLVYERGGGDPSELLDSERFDSAYAVEDHLIHGLVDAAYAPDPGLPEGAVGRERWSAGEARRWLTFLAGYLHDHRERDLAWWLLSGRLLSPWAGPVTGLVLGAVLVLAAMGWMTATEVTGPYTRPYAIAFVWIVGCVFALFNSLVWYASEARPPGRLTWSVRGSAGRLLRGFRSGAVAALVSVSPVILAMTFMRVIAAQGGRATPESVERYVEAVTITAALATVGGLALAAHNWLDAPPSRATQVSPLNSLAQDRGSAVLSATVAGLVVALTGLVGWYAGLVCGDVLLRLLTNWTGWPGPHDVGLLAEDRWDAVTGLFDENWTMIVGVTMLLPGVFFALLVLMGRAWPRFVVVRCYLAARGKLPWRLMTFLADARRRELLRQSGGVYQFRHIRLQETLAGESTLADSGRVREEAARRALVRRRTVLTVGAGAMAVGTAWAIGRRRDGSVAQLALPGRESVGAVAMWPEAGRQVAFALDDGTVRKWTGETADRTSTVVREAPIPDEYYDSGTPALAFSADGRFLFTSRGGEAGVLALNLSSRGSQLFHAPMEDLYGPPLIAGHHDLVAWTSDSHIRVWRRADDGTDTLVAEINFEITAYGDDARDASIIGMAFLADGSLAVLGDAGGMWRCLPPQFDKLRSGPPYSKLWDVLRDNSYDPDSYSPVSGSSLAVSPHDGSLLLCGPKGAELWRGDGTTTWSRASFALGSSVGPGTFHPTRPVLAVADGYGDVQLWHTDDPRRGRRLTGHSNSVLSLDFSSDGHWLATASDDGTIRLWDVSDLS